MASWWTSPLVSLALTLTGQLTSKYAVHHRSPKPLRASHIPKTLCAIRKPVIGERILFLGGSIQNILI